MSQSNTGATKGVIVEGSGLTLNTSETSWPDEYGPTLNHLYKWAEVGDTAFTKLIQNKPNIATKECSKRFTDDYDTPY